MNLNNYGIIKGRLTDDPKVFENSDGSKKVRMTIAAQNNFKDKDGKTSSQFLPVEAFVPAARASEGIGVYGLIHEGDKVTVQYTVRNNNYTDKNGEKQYALVLAIETIQMEEPKSVTDARQAAKAVANAQAAAAQAQA